MKNNLSSLEAHMTYWTKELESVIRDENRCPQKMTDFTKVTIENYPDFFTNPAYRKERKVILDIVMGSINNIKYIAYALSNEDKIALIKDSIQNSCDQLFVDCWFALSMEEAGAILKDETENSILKMESFSSFLSTYLQQSFVDCLQPELPERASLFYQHVSKGLFVLYKPQLEKIISDFMGSDQANYILRDIAQAPTCHGFSKPEEKEAFRFLMSTIFKLVSPYGEYVDFKGVKTILFEQLIKNKLAEYSPEFSQDEVKAQFMKGLEMGSASIVSFAGLKLNHSEAAPFLLTAYENTSILHKLLQMEKGADLLREFPFSPQTANAIVVELIQYYLQNVTQITPSMEETLFCALCSVRAQLPKQTARLFVIEKGSFNAIDLELAYVAIYFLSKGNLRLDEEPLFEESLGNRSSILVEETEKQEESEEELKNKLLSFLKKGMELNFSEKFHSEQNDQLFQELIAQVVRKHPDYFKRQDVIQELIILIEDEKLLNILLKRLLVSQLSPEILYTYFDRVSHFITDYNETIKLFERFSLEGKSQQALQCLRLMPEAYLPKLFDKLVQEKNSLLFNECCKHLSLENKKLWLTLEVTDDESPVFKDEKHVFLAKAAIRNRLETYAASLDKHSLDLYTDFYSVNKNLFELVLVETLEEKAADEIQRGIARSTAHFLRDYDLAPPAQQACLKATLERIIDMTIAGNDLFFNNLMSNEERPNFLGPLLKNSKTMEPLQSFLGDSPLFLKKMLCAVFERADISQINLFLQLATSYIDKTLLFSPMEEKNNIIVIQEIITCLINRQFKQFTYPEFLAAFLTSNLVIKYLHDCLEALSTEKFNDNKNLIHLYFRIVSLRPRKETLSFVQELYSRSMTCINLLCDEAQNTVEFAYLFLQAMSDEQLKDYIMHSGLDLPTLNEILGKRDITGHVLKRKTPTLLNAYLDRFQKMEKEWSFHSIEAIVHLSPEESDPLIKTLLLHPSSVKMIVLKYFISNEWSEHLLEKRIRPLFNLDEWLTLLLSLLTELFEFRRHCNTSQAREFEKLLSDVLIELPLTHQDYDTFFNQLLEATQDERHKEFRQLVLETHCKKLHATLHNFMPGDAGVVKALETIVEFSKCHSLEKLLDSLVDTLMRGKHHAPEIIQLLQPVYANNGDKIQQLELSSKSSKDIREEYLRNQKNLVVNLLPDTPANKIVTEALLFDEILSYLKGKYDEATKKNTDVARANYTQRVNHYKNVHLFILKALQNPASISTLSQALNTYIKSLPRPKGSTYLGMNFSDDRYMKLIEKLPTVSTETLIQRFNELVEKIDGLATANIFGTPPHIKTLFELSKRFEQSQQMSPNNNNNNNSDGPSSGASSIILS